ncbi:hypothetical protein AHF37_00475 [Paragonimus kellicotti]|nr:hypothetical protein AHF37_00475 [Paragonimus kellicotti]
MSFVVQQPKSIWKSVSTQVFSAKDSQIHVDCTIVGGGIVGLATARELSIRHPSMKFAVVEKEKDLSLHQSKNNSGVVHAGIYYAPGSLKAKLCVQGLERSYKYFKLKNIPHRACGKLIIATNEQDVLQLDALYERALANGVPGVRMINSDQIREIEPKCVGTKAIYSPETGIVDWRSVALSYAQDFRQNGGQIYTNFTVHAFTENTENTEYPVHIHALPEATISSPTIKTKYVITCAGLQSDRIAKLTGCTPYPKIIPFRGAYLKLKEDKCDLVKTNIYPVPNPNFPFLGVHFTPRIDGSVWLGPNALLSFDREGYGQFDFKLSDAIDSLTYPGFWRLAKKYFSYGLNEMVCNVLIRRQVKHLQKFVPSLKLSDVIRGPSGIRAQALSLNGDLVDDFVIDFGKHGIGKLIMHVRNAPSPAATSSLAIASMLADNFEEMRKSQHQA